jgi:hypothetical protein
LTPALGAAQDGCSDRQIVTPIRFHPVTRVATRVIRAWWSWMTVAVVILAAAAPGSARAATISLVDSAGDVGLGSAVAYGPDGLALISYLDLTNGGALKVAHCNDVACTAAVKSTIDGSGNVAGSTSIAFGPDGRGLISYQAGTSIKVAHCADVVCSAATLSTVDGV